MSADLPALQWSESRVVIAFQPAVAWVGHPIFKHFVESVV